MRPDLMGHGPYDDDVEEFLENMFFYVCAAARREFPCGVGLYDTDDLVQEVLIKLWLITRKQAITSPKAYVRQVVRNEKIDLLRRDKPYTTLPVNEDGEICQGKVLLMGDEEYGSPEKMVVEKEALSERVSELRDVIAKLYPRQKLASLYRLKREADVPELEGMFGEDWVDAEEWLEVDEYERQLLNSSYSPVRRKLAKRMNVDLKQYK